MRSQIAAGAALLLVAILATSCGSESSHAGSGGDIYDNPALEVYDNEHTTATQLHLPAGVSADYTVIPPYGEEHSPIPLACGIYSATPSFEMVVHAMEHGAVVLWYAPESLNVDDIAALTEIASRHLNDSSYVIQAPYGGLDAPLMLVAWGVRLPLGGVDQRAIEQFFDEFHDEAPEPLAAGGCATAR
ncbi:MAG: DUF3105 domain-containing protein [Chloroflexi bacterium]|nr:DUF3105 domain-containing protein [Chloroflexota bacterium]MCY3697639.1 DUF3105 domain-containing protein [Chloroflexota bacterium]